jgi:pimeloyl-ACP methyl ester carboxylesterase
MKRRRFLELAAGAAVLPLAANATAAEEARMDASADIANLPPYGNGILPVGVRSRRIEGVNGLTVHTLEAGEAQRPALLLLHGFPELAFSWRKVMLPLAAAGYHVIAPDQRGYGRTTGWDGSHDADPDPFRMLNMVRDALALVLALGYREVAAVIGRDAGAPVAAWSALIRPDVFRAVVLMTSPFARPPPLPFDTANGAKPPPPPMTDDELDAELARLDPPRKYYQNYQRTRGANADMLHAPQGLAAFFRAYWHYKSADWKGNKPHPLKARTAAEMAQMPTYYVMERDKGMAATVAPFMPSAAEIAACKWLTDAEVAVYATEYARTEFTGALQGYRVRRGTDRKCLAEMHTFFGRTIDVPSMYVAGKSDWGTWQFPGAAEAMQQRVLTRMQGFHLVDGAGHWVQEEQPAAVTELLLAFLQKA